MSNVIKARRVVTVGRDEPSPREEAVSVPRRDKSAVVSAARAFLNEAPLLEHARRRGRMLLESAASDADRIVREAEEKRHELLEQFREEGFAAGFAAGKERGRAEGRDELQHCLSLLVGAVEEVRSMREQLLQHHFEDIVDLAVELAAKLTRRAGGFDEATTRGLLLEMLPRAVGHERIVVRLVEDDLAALREELGPLRDVAGAGSEVEFVGDEGLRSGDVVVETDGGTLDGTGPVRVRRLVQQLLDVIEYGG